MLFGARQGQTSGRNVDLTVKGYKSACSWMGEAEIYKTIENLREGSLYRSTRYRNARPVHAKSGIQAFTKRNDAAECLKQWLDETITMGLEDFSITCSRRGQLAFYTTHKVKAFGLPIQVRHSAVTLYQLPKDRRGLEAKNMKQHILEKAAANLKSAGG